MYTGVEMDEKLRVIDYRIQQSVKNSLLNPELYLNSCEKVSPFSRSLSMDISPFCRSLFMDIGLFCRFLSMDISLLFKVSFHGSNIALLNPELYFNSCEKVSPFCRSLFMDIGLFCRSLFIV